MMKRESRYGRGVLETEVVSQLKNLGVRTGYLRRSVDSHAGLTWYTSQGKRERERGWRGAGWVNLGLPKVLEMCSLFLSHKKNVFCHTKM